MIRENQKYLNRLLVVIDAVSILAALTFSWYFRFISGIIRVADGYMTFHQYLLPVIFVAPIYLIIYSLFRLYTPYRTKNVFDEFLSVLKANVTGILVFILILYLLKEIDYSRYLLFVFAVFNTLLTSIERSILRYSLRKMRKKGLNLKHILIVGYSDLTNEFLLRLKKNRQWGYNVVGILDDSKAASKEAVKDFYIDNIERTTFEEIAAAAQGNEIIGNICSLEYYLNKFEIDEVFITLNIKEYDKLGYIINTCEKSGVRTQIIPDYFKYIPAKPYVEEVDGLPIINIRYVPLDNLFNSLIKRIFDIICSLICIIIFSPVMIITSLIIKITSPGPVLFKQERVGLNKKTFEMYKFRSMKVQKDDEEKIKWTTPGDPRKTQFGNFIRKTSIDELPQLFNVLKGDMSLVGPRPERPYFVDKFREEIPKYMIKHQVRPGITGWAQVNGWRGDTSIEKRIEFDIHYIENWSMLLDIKILFLTIFKGFVNKNAY
jgi:Undecaprenyl-phosphate glucose phosphotransferase